MTGPIFITGLSHSGKTELRRALEASGGVWLTRKEEMWDRLAPLAAAEATARLAGRHGADRWGVQRKDLEWVAAELLTGLPEARVVHVVRDPLDRAIATGGLGRPGRLGWGHARWVASTRRGLELADRHPDRYLIVSCDELVEEPSVAVRRITTFLDLDAVDAAELDVEWDKLGRMTSDRSLDLGVGGPERERAGLPTAAASGHLLRRGFETLVYAVGRSWLRARGGRNDE